MTDAFIKREIKLPGCGGGHPAHIRSDAGRCEDIQRRATRHRCRDNLQNAGLIRFTLCDFSTLSMWDQFSQIRSGKGGTFSRILQSDWTITEDLREMLSARVKRFRFSASITQENLNNSQKTHPSHRCDTDIMPQAHLY